MCPDIDAEPTPSAGAEAAEGAAHAGRLLGRIGCGASDPQDLASLMQFLHSGDLLHGACVVLHEALRKALRGRARAVSPFDGMRKLRPDLAARYNGTAQQRARIVERLRRRPATRSEIERDCSVPSVTKRISELRRIGWRIEGKTINETAPDGGVNLATVYSLNDGTTAQADLFDPA